MSPTPADRLGWFLAPAAVLLGFLLLPIGALVLLTPPGRLASCAADPQVRSAFLLSISAAFAASAAGLLFGVPLAYLLARRAFRGKRIVEALLDLPVVLPHTAAGVALLFVFGRRTALGGWLERHGLSLTGSFAGIALAMAFVSVPYLVGAARESFRLVDRRLEDTARTLGASPLTAFRRVALPLASRGIASGFVLMWARGVSEFGSVVIIAYHPLTAPVLLWDRFERYGLSQARPLGALLVLAALALLVLAQVVAGRVARVEERRA